VHPLEAYLVELGWEGPMPDGDNPDFFKYKSGNGKLVSFRKVNGSHHLFYPTPGMQRKKGDGQTELINLSTTQVQKLSILLPVEVLFEMITTPGFGIIVDQNQDRTFVYSNSAYLSEDLPTLREYLDRS